MKRSVTNEQFFTISENVDFCLSKIDLQSFKTIMEPSAGDGAFSKKIENCVAFDLNPMSDDIKKQDFLAFIPELFDIKSPTLVIGNPPFGRQSSLAIKFINKAASFADKIAFVLPKSFKKESMISRLNKHVFLESVFELPTTTFYFEDKKFEIPCSFFIFDVKRNELRPEIEKFNTDDFVFTDKLNADNSIRRVGFYAGKIEGLDVSESTHYFVKWVSPTAKERFSKLHFNHDNTVGARSLSKNELVKAYLSQG